MIFSLLLKMRIINTLLIVLIAVLAIGCYGCSEKKTPSLITGNVISRFGPEDMNPVVNAQDKPSVNISLNSTLNLPKPTVKEIVDKAEADNAPSTSSISADKIPSPIECDNDKINLGYKDCFNTTSGIIKLILKNAGHNNITGILFNIEIKGTPPNYEIANKGLKINEFVTYNLDMARWKEKYKRTDRIIMIPLKKGNDGQNTCFNRALLLVPLDSCDKYLIEK